MRSKNQRNEIHRTDKLMLPADSAEFVEKVEAVHGITAINPYLSHNRIYRYVREEGNRKTRRERKESLLFEVLQKKPVCGAEFCGNGNEKSDGLENLSEMLNDRNQIIAGHFPGKQQPYLFQLSSKLICEMGGESPYGNIQLLRLHHVFGIPYIPASAIKGGLRNYMILEQFRGDEEKAEKTEEFRELFGAKEDGMQAEGKLIFFDAFPSCFQMSLDVQTPHFKRYYETEREAPLDDEHPVPLFFTCVEKAKFRIYLSCRDGEIWKKYEKTLDGAMKGLFEDYGIGAKTSLGYGIGTLE